MARREDLWMKYGGLNTTGTNLFDNYNDPYDYTKMKEILDKIGVDTSNMMRRSAADTIQRGQKDTAARLASEGITGGSVFNNQVNKVVDTVGSDLTDQLEKLGIDLSKENIPLMQTANENKFRSTQAQQNVIMQNIMNAMNKLNSQGNYLSGWEQSDRANDAANFNFFRDLFPGLLSGGAQVASARISKSDVRIKKRIKYVGISDEGIPIVEFNYMNNDNNRYRGAIAQDVEKIKPEAVIEIDGIKHIDYSKIDVKFEKIS